MSGEGAPKITLEGARDLRVAVVAARWHEDVMNGLLGGALSALEEAGVHDPLVVRVAGSFELPVAAARLARAKYDAVIALGVIIRGETPHFDFVCQAATDGLTRVAVDTGVPIGFGVLTCDTVEQALARAGLPGSGEDKGREATEAALAAELVLRERYV